MLLLHMVCLTHKIYDRLQASGASAIALGHGAQATGTQSISIGTGNQVSGNHSGALGDPTIVTGDNSYSVGNNNTLSTKNTFALGNAITTTIGNDVVLGTGSASYATGTATKGTAAYSSETIEGITYNYAGNTAPANVISVGATGAEGRIQNVAAGLVSTTSTDAINGSQLYDTNKALGNLAGNTAAALGGGTTLNPDGTLAGKPQVVSQSGITDGNRPQAGRHAELAVRAVELAAPFDLPAKYYNAWKRVSAFRFDRKLSQ